MAGEKLADVDLGGAQSGWPESAHVAYFWNTAEEFSDGVTFLEVGLRGADHGVIFGHDDANREVCRILESRGLDLTKLAADGRLTILRGHPDVDQMLEEIGQAFERALAGGASLVRLLGNIGWSHADWPDEQALLRFEARVTEAAKQFPCVVVCMYDVAGLPGTIVHHGGLGTHPHVLRNGHPQNNPQYLPLDIFLRRIETLAGAIGERRRHDETLHHITEGTVQFIGDEFFRQLARHLADALHVRYCFVAECTDDSQTRLRALAFWDGQGFAQNVEYPIRGTPCEKVIEGNICSYPDRIQQLFPEDQDLVTLGAESYAGVPLPNSQGKVLGHLVVMDNRPRHFDENELRVLRIFANRAGIELERLRADRKVSQLNGELTALLEINRAIGRQLEREHLFGALSDCLKSVVPTERFGIEIPLDGNRLEGHILSNGASIGAPTEPTILPAAGTACDWVLQTHQWFIAGSRDEFRDRFPVTYRVMSEQGMESLCAVALVSGGRNRGALFFMASVKDAYRDLRRNFIEQVANQIALAIENVNSYEEIAALNQKIAATAARRQTLLEVNNAIVTKLTREELLAVACDALSKVIWFDRLALSLYDPAIESLRIVACAGPYQRQDYSPIGRQLKLDDSPAGQAFQSQRPILCGDLETERRTASEERAYGHGFRSICVLPLVVHGRSLGAITVGSLTRCQYSAADAEFLMEVANQIAIAVENMQLHEETAALKARFEAETVYLQEEIKTEHNFEEIIGQSEKVRELLRKVEQVAPTDASVLICGETGTGKELLARAVHDRSKRKDRALVKVNCGSIPSGLVESELFGHEKGAFTGAMQQRIGRFELAHGGTIFLDEVTELPLDTQVKLLRVLQEGEFERVGSSKTMKVDVRVIAATNRDLNQVVSKGSFRADLYYRLNVFPLESPALRDRKDDLPLLVSFFLSRFGKKLGKEVRGVAQKSMESLVRYNWPGNIRELQNVVERAVVLARGPVVQVDESMLRSDSAAAAEVSAIDTLENNERNHILHALAETNWVIHGKKGAAELLGINPSTLRSRMDKLGIKRQA
jgi:formate hydrogenlyase transcriptional activator